MAESSPHPKPRSSEADPNHESPLKAQRYLDSTHFRCQVLSRLSVADTTLNRLNILLSTSSGLDTVLAAIDYVSHALHHLLASALFNALQSRLQTLLSLLTAKATSIRTLRRRKAPIPPSPLNGSINPSLTPLLTLSSLVSEARYTLRLLGLVSIWASMSETVKSPPADCVLCAIAFLQIFASTIYQTLENIAYLASKEITGKRLVDRWGGVGKWYLWSTRAWVAHVALDFVRLGREHLLRKQHARRGESERLSERVVPNMATDVREAGNGSAGEAEAAAAEKKTKQEVLEWKKSLVSNLAWTPLYIHWSIEQGIGVPNSWTGFLSLVAGAWNTYDSWTATALP